ncbi:unnamed protein product [Pocillopora meandrina]|uniref:Uncharacterized protein n=1 Tax=Pocillopora meandrina TaxID=46732 RepID=A0AAU9X236_9CNID|nr:unnamed protein product [Pocillopora meandrina]
MISLKIQSTHILMENLFLLAITLLSTAFAERVQDTLQELFQSMNKTHTKGAQTNNGSFVKINLALLHRGLFFNAMMHLRM